METLPPCSPSPLTVTCAISAPASKAFQEYLQAQAPGSYENELSTGNPVVSFTSLTMFAAAFGKKQPAVS